jgi:hypothetical protein
LNGLAPDVFSNFFRFNSFYHGYATRNAGDLVSEPRSTVRSSLVARHLGPVVWNTFPDSIREAESVPQFKKRLKKHLLTGGWWVWGWKTREDKLSSFVFCSVFNIFFFYYYYFFHNLLFSNDYYLFFLLF